MVPAAGRGDAYAMTLRLVRLVTWLTLALLLAAGAALGARAQSFERPSLPFHVGESLEFEVRVARLGRVGEGRMWVEGPVDERGVQTWRLRFELEAGKGPIRGIDRTSSWIDPARFATTRFAKEERHPLSRSKEEVLVHADSGTWRDKEGPSGKLASPDPLDELSFLYFLRTLPIDRDTTLSISRHFDEARNPTVVRISDGGEIRTPAGIFRTRLITMEVRDPKRYKGTGTIRIHLNDGECRVPVRIESRMPVFGATTLSLKAYAHPPGYPGTIAC